MSSGEENGADITTPGCAREGCHKLAIKRGETGPPRRYCSAACRQAAYRQRRRGQTAVAVEERDVIGDAVKHLDEAFAAIPNEKKRSRGADRLLRLCSELRQYHEASSS